MSFYEQLSFYYNYIFPLNQNQLSLIEAVAGTPPKHVLDIACGTGSYSIALAKMGYHVTAIDLDKEMIHNLSEKAKLENVLIEAIRGDMLDIHHLLHRSYDMAFCIGNSLVHLHSYQEISSFLKTIYQTLNKDGNLVIQIINYDRIIENHIYHLPTIEVPEHGLSFERLYQYDSDLNLIHFITTLKVNDQEMVNSIQLIPLLHHDLIDLISEAGFSYVQSYGDFKKTEYKKSDSYALVIIAKK